MKALSYLLMILQVLDDLWSIRILYERATSLCLAVDNLEASNPHFQEMIIGFMVTPRQLSHFPGSSFSALKYDRRFPMAQYDEDIASYGVRNYPFLLVALRRRRMPFKAMLLGYITHDASLSFKHSTSTSILRRIFPSKSCIIIWVNMP